MKTIEIKTGMTRVELEKFYITNIQVLISLNFTEEEARKIVQDTFRETLGL